MMQRRRRNRKKMLIRESYKSGKRKRKRRSEIRKKKRIRKTKSVQIRKARQEKNPSAFFLVLCNCIPLTFSLCQGLNNKTQEQTRYCWYADKEGQERTSACDSFHCFEYCSLISICASFVARAASKQPSPTFSPQW